MIRNPKLTVSMPHYRTPPEMLRRAVESVLSQTFDDLQLIVVNDGDDPERAWEALKDFTDPRLIRFDLEQNRGRYYADAVTAAAANAQWWSPHDSDDWSEEGRFEKMLAEGGEAVFCECIYHKRDGTLMHDKIKPYRLKKGELRTIARYPAGVYRTDIISKLGIDGSIRLSHDTPIVVYMFRKHDVRVVHDPLYHVIKRNGSLTTDPSTKKGSGDRSAHRQAARNWYRHKIAGKAFPGDLRIAIAQDAKRLGEML